MKPEAAALPSVERLRELLGPDRVLVADEIPPVYRRDMLTPNRGFAMPPTGWTPSAVVRPDSTEAVATVLRTASEEGLKLVCRGAGTSLMGSAAPLGGEAILDLSGMNRVLRIDRASRRAVVQPGATIRKVEDRAGVHGLMLGHDPWTRAYATVGGAIAPDGLGFLAPRYGSMGEMVLGLTMVLPDGTVAIQRPAERAPGLRLSRLAVGQEGTLGVVTEAVLRLRPVPEVRTILAYGFPDFPSGFRAAVDLRDLSPSLLDFIEPFEAQRRMPGGDDDRVLTFYAGFEGPSKVVAAQVREARRLLRAHGGRRRADRVAREYWEGRHKIADLVARDDSGRSEADAFWRDLWFDYVHVALPLGRVLDYRAKALSILARHAILPTEVAVFTQPELLNVYFLKPRGDGDVGRDEMELAVDELIHLCHAMDGSMEYCHGIGTRLARFLPEELGAGLEVYDRIKTALDPRDVLPTLGRRAI